MRGSSVVYNWKVSFVYGRSWVQMTPTLAAVYCLDSAFNKATNTWRAFRMYYLIKKHIRHCMVWAFEGDLKLTKKQFFSNIFCPYIPRTAVAQWLMCCATNRKVAGSIPDGVIGIFHGHNISDRTKALGSTQPLTEMSTRRISWG